MAEWLKAHAWKACLGETLTRVRIPLSPPRCSSTSRVPAKHESPWLKPGSGRCTICATGEVGVTIWFERGGVENGFKQGIRYIYQQEGTSLGRPFYDRCVWCVAPFGD